LKSSLLGPIVALVFLATFSPMVMIWGIENQRVDQCLDRGGSFDYAELRCDLVADHAFVPFVNRRPKLVRLAQAGSLVIVALGAFAVVIRMRGVSGGRAT
jgi:hypothetical protein